MYIYICIYDSRYNHSVVLVNQGDRDKKRKRKSAAVDFTAGIACFSQLTSSAVDL
jgi:hypothetical protein